MTTKPYEGVMYAPQLEEQSFETIDDVLQKTAREGARSLLQRALETHSYNQRHRKRLRQRASTNLQDERNGNSPSHHRDGIQVDKGSGKNLAQDRHMAAVGTRSRRTSIQRRSPRRGFSSIGSDFERMPVHQD